MGQTLVTNIQLINLLRFPRKGEIFVRQTRNRVTKCSDGKPIANLNDFGFQWIRVKRDKLRIKRSLFVRKGCTFLRIYERTIRIVSTLFQFFVMLLLAKPLNIPSERESKGESN